MSEPTQARKAPNEWWVGAVAGMASYIDAAALVATGIALAIYMGTIGLSPDHYGYLQSALGFSVAIGAVVGGRLGDTFGRRRVFLTTMTMIVIGTTLMTFGVSFPVLLAGIIVMGLGVGADLPVSLATIAEAASDKNRGKIILLSNLLWLGGIVSVVMLASFAGHYGRISGQIMFGLVGVMAALVLIGRLTIPESTTWTAARDERRAGIKTARAENASVKDLLTGPYAKPFIVLLAFYGLTNLYMNTNGQFNTFIATNIAGSTVEEFNRWALISMVVGGVIGLLAMRVIDTKYRMPFYILGGVFLVGAPLIMVVGGITLTTLVASLFVSTVGGAFAFEGIMKVWTQESFPTMLRSTAQGSIVAFARLAASALAAFTPALLINSGQAFYGVLALAVATGLIVAYVFFSKHTVTTFASEGELTEAAEPRIPAAATEA
ncbi:MFS transporter [Demequina zhanjiangensis]|uniref:MFS transporter n=1 Tax=Demequina zhanjiangensis TaxID=3051659 RepID=A0ABT8G3W5_9MICO|nr:MFS transporter [Demequina sp. SYSU T00b26]MDN4473825.1 MFS transporter [Demequina sp. SYSU T00b26]